MAQGCYNPATGQSVEISIKNLEASSELDVPPRSWERILGVAAQLASELFTSAGVALRVVDDGEIRRLNRDFRGVDESTDVLSFPAEPGSGQHAGDLALSWDTARRQAATNGNSIEDECIALITHGLLHLAGYDHDTDAQEARMEARQRELLDSVGVRTAVYGH